MGWNRVNTRGEYSRKKDKLVKGSNDGLSNK